MGLFDDVVQGINREITKVQSRGQEMMQTYQLNSQIRSLEGKKTATLIDIGRLVFEKYQRAAEVSEETLIEKAKEITGYDHEIAELQTQRDQMQAQYDPSRSASERAEAKAGYKTTPGFVCPHCQAPASRDKAFCPSCGGSLKEGGNGTSAVDDENGNE
jgi:prefoldin subunit 5